MPNIWYILSRRFGRQALIAFGILAVMVSAVQFNCLPQSDDDVLADVQAVIGGDQGLGELQDPDGCGHCHCAAPSAIVNDHGAVILAQAVGRNLRSLHHDDAPAGVSFAPDPPPNRA